ncbi:MAG: tRNA pseudouridine(55) synthase TruB [Planctomycetota bacterium]|jgi:tRNA pseudouridine55 synthase
MNDAQHGVVVLDKPAGVSSAKALAPLKAFGKVGHAGTLDPFATGVLLALVNDATRLSSLAMALPKTYIAYVLFGNETDTLDPDGEVVAHKDPGAAPPADLEDAVSALTGDILQEPPAYSALKVGGRRAYKLARGGEAPELAPRPVTVHSMRIVGVEWPRVELEVVCGAGTYIRSIARDLGRAIGIPASLVALRRTAIGPFTVEQADPDIVQPPLALIRAADVPIHDTNLDNAYAFVTGRPVPAEAEAGERWAVVCGDLVLGLAISDGEALRPASVFATSRAQIETQHL